VDIINLFFIGVISWPILEYCLHRFSGHTYKFPKVFHVEHQTHHIEKDYFAPAWKKMLAAILILIPLTFLNYLWLNLISAFVFSSGFIFMYLVYEVVHYSFHAYAPKTKLGLILRKHHFSHHFVSPKYNHGVTNNLIDRLMGTYKKVDLVYIPKKFAMNWLVDHDGSIKKQFQSHFQLKG
jgi:sterol desaturase/sphingolipid hydroxylase (fatty acid hydroxylase superfamily)